MNLRVIIERIEDDYAVLRTENGEEIFFPLNLLPEAAEGKVLQLQSADEETGDKRRETNASEQVILAKTILNEIFG